MLTERQEKLLGLLIKEYIGATEPVSSKLLKKSAGLNICEATVRNEMQELMDKGYIYQPHTSAGRVPTKKAYRYFADKIASETEKDFSAFIFHQIKAAREQIEQEMRLAEELMASLSETSMTLSISHMPEKDDLFEILNILGSSNYNKNIDIINSIIKELEDF